MFTVKTLLSVKNVIRVCVCVEKERSRVEYFTFLSVFIVQIRTAPFIV